MEIRKATTKDIDIVLSLIDEGRKIMRENGNYNQWEEGYPKISTIENDISCGNSYLCIDKNKIVATFALVSGEDITYKKIYQGEWIDNTLPYFTIHRIASKAGSHGIFKAIIEYCSNITNNIRVDTHRDNTIMQHNLIKHGFKYCGIIYIENGDERLAYQRLTLWLIR